MEQIKIWLCNKRINVNEGDIHKHFTIDQALNKKNSLAKNIYTMLFKWIVNKINKCLESNNTTKSNTFIGILDIYGFETVGKNSYEQLCINYANDKLHQQFIQVQSLSIFFLIIIIFFYFKKHFFINEQEEYKKEKIDWEIVEFNDNQKNIQLIEGKCGIFNLLDDELKVNFINTRLYFFSLFCLNFIDSSKNRSRLVL